MIQVAVAPGTLVAGQPSVLTIKLSNTSLDACSDVVFRLELPPGMALISGRNKIVANEIRGGQVHVHQLTVLPGQPGDAEVSTSNFSYRDEDGITRRRDDWRVSVLVLAAGSGRDRPAPASSPGRSRSRPRLAVSPGGRTLTSGKWDVLEIFLRNETGADLHNIAVTLDGPFRTDHVSARFRLLRHHETGRAQISVHVPDLGQVPVSVHATYQYHDERGRLSSGAQDDRLTVEVAARAEKDRPEHEKAATTTILYLAAQPYDTVPLSSYAEMREVEGLLQLGRDRDRYRLEHRVATRLRDISQALGQYWPQIVHFSGHGNQDGSLVVEDNAGRASSVDPDGLASLLGGFAESVRCVIVNACHSLTLAEAMSQHIDYVVGMRSEILDEASVQFSVGFYQGLFAGKTVPDAFRQGRDLVRAELKTNSEYTVPVLLSRSKPT
jgi:hypothetical protein